MSLGYSKEVKFTIKALKHGRRRIMDVMEKNIVKRINLATLIIGLTSAHCNISAFLELGQNSYSATSPQQNKQKLECCIA